MTGDGEALLFCDTCGETWRVTSIELTVSRHIVITGHCSCCSNNGYNEIEIDAPQTVWVWPPEDRVVPLLREGLDYDEACTKIAADQRKKVLRLRLEAPPWSGPGPR
jgi:hypothetical protein